MSDLERAKALLKSTPSLTCVLCRGESVCQSEKKGVVPMMGFLEDGIDLRGFCAADRVVGKAAAFLFVLAGVRELYTDVLSEHARQVLDAYGISVTYGKLTPYIINRRGDGMCPMETAVKDVTDPNVAYSAILQTMSRLGISTH